MDINEIKQVPIVDFLYILGIEPVKHKASGLWYHAPYRNDRNPSLRVSTDKNVWYDYGIARGGDIFNLAGEFINLVAASRHRFRIIKEQKKRL